MVASFHPSATLLCSLNLQAIALSSLMHSDYLSFWSNALATSCFCCFTDMTAWKVCVASESQPSLSILNVSIVLTSDYRFLPQYYFFSTQYYFLHLELVFNLTFFFLTQYHFLKLVLFSLALFSYLSVIFFQLCIIFSTQYFIFQLSIFFIFFSAQYYLFILLLFFSNVLLFS